MPAVFLVVEVHDPWSCDSGREGGGAGGKGSLGHTGTYVGPFCPLVLQEVLGNCSGSQAQRRKVDPEGAGAVRAGQGQCGSGGGAGGGHQRGGLMGRPVWECFYFRGWFLSPWETAWLLSHTAAGRGDRLVGHQNLSLRCSGLGVEGKCDLAL